MFYHIEVDAIDGSREEISIVRFSMARSEEVLEESSHNRLLLNLCEICDIQSSADTCFECGATDYPESTPFSNVKCVRSWNSTADVQCVLHIGTPPMPTRVGCKRYGGYLRWPNVSRVVFTIRNADSDMDEWMDPDAYPPKHIDSFVLIYLPEADIEMEKAERRKQARAHSQAYHNIVKKAWNEGKTVTVVNAASLDTAVQNNLSFLDHAANGPHTKGESNAIDILRRRAIRAVITGNKPPEPICPVHFVTLEEYRAHVGEFEYVVDIENSGSRAVSSCPRDLCESIADEKRWVSSSLLL